MGIISAAFKDASTSLVIIFLVFNLFLNMKKRSILSYILVIVLSTGVAYFTMINDWFSVFKTFFYFYVSLTLFKGTIPNKIITVVLICQLGMVLDFANGFFAGVRSSGGSATIIEVFAIILLIVLNWYRRGKSPLIQYFNKMYTLVWLLVTLNVILISAIVTSIEFSEQMKGILSAIIVLASGIDIYFCYYLEKTQKLFEENLIIQKQIEFQENKLEQNKSYLEKNNRLMHDIKKHYLEIEHALSENQLEYVKEYMQGIYKQYFATTEPRFTGNQVIDSMFYSLQEQCQKTGIQLNHSIMIDHQIFFKDKDLAALLGSLFDNAVDKANSSKEDRVIKVTMYTKKHRLIIVVEIVTIYAEEQLVPDSEVTKNPVNDWQKIQLIHRIVEKYNGLYESKKEQGIESGKIILPLNQND